MDVFVHLEQGVKKLFDEENPDAAIAHLAHVVELDPINDKAWFALGMAHFQMRNYLASEAAFTRCIEMETARAGVGAAYALRFMARSHIGHYVGARQDYEQAVLDPKIADYLRSLSRADFGQSLVLRAAWPSRAQEIVRLLLDWSPKISSPAAQGPTQ